MKFDFVPELEIADANLQTGTGEILIQKKRFVLCIYIFGENFLLKVH